MKFNLKKFDFLSLFKPVLIAFLIVTLIGGVIFGIFGFNKGFDYVGGTQLVVDFSLNQTSKTEAQIESDADLVKQILNENNIKVNSFQLQGKYSSMSFVVTFKDTNIDLVRKVRLEINEKLNFTQTYADLKLGNEAEKIVDDANYNFYDLTKNTTTINSLVNPNFVLEVVSTLLFALIICMVYALFRVKVAGALSIMLGGVLSVLMTALLVVLTRIEINIYFVALLGLVELVSIFSSANFVFEVKQNSKDIRLTDKTNYELALWTVQNSLNKNLLIYVATLVLTLIIGLVAVVNILKLMLIAIIGLVVTFAVNHIVVPGFWAMASKKRELVKPVLEKTNDVDASSEVIEIVEE